MSSTFSKKLATCLDDTINILVHDVINLFYYQHLTDKQKYFYVCLDESETRSSWQLITGYSNNIISCDDISSDQFLFIYYSVFILFSFSIIPFFFSQPVIRCASSRIPFDCMFY